MLKIALTNRIINSLAKKVIGKILAKKLGINSDIKINELYAIENEGKVKLKIDVEVEISSEEAEFLIDIL